VVQARVADAQAVRVRALADVDLDGNGAGRLGIGSVAPLIFLMYVCNSSAASFAMRGG